MPSALWQRCLGTTIDLFLTCFAMPCLSLLRLYDVFVCWPQSPEPGVVLPAIDYADLHSALAANAAKAGLQPLPAFLDKAVQLYEMIVVRHGLMLASHACA